MNFSFSSRFAFFAISSSLSASAQIVPTENFPDIRLPEGLSLSRFADSSQIVNPTTLCIDSQNRVYVAETHRWRVQVQDIRGGGKNNRFLRQRLLGDISSMTLADREAYHKKWSGKDPLFLKWEQFDDQSEVIKLLEDENGDGRADKVIRYRDDFNASLAGPASGLIEKDGSVYFAMIPGIYRLQDRDGDGKAEEVKTLVDGFGVRVSFSGHDLNGFAFGPDGKLYWSIGDRGYHVEQEGKTFARPDSGAIFRSNPDGSEFEEFAVNLRNPKEIVFDQFGNLFTVDNDYDNGDKERIVYLVEHGDSGWKMGHQTIASFGRSAFNHLGSRPANKEDQLDAWMNEGLWRPRHARQPAHIIPPVALSIDGPCGFTYNPGGSSLPKRFDHNFFIVTYKASPERSGIQRFSLKPDGASFAVKETTEFLRGVAATDLDWGYDGKLYVTDYGGGWLKSNRGNVYALADKEGMGKPVVKEVKELFAKGFQEMTSQRLFELLAHADQRVRTRAQFALAERGTNSLSWFESGLERDQPLLRRVHSLWGVGQIVKTAPASIHILANLLKDPEMEVRANAARTMGNHPSLLKPYQDDLIERLNDPAPRVVALAAIALANQAGKESVAPAIALLERNEDRDVVVRHGGIMILAQAATAAQLAQLSSHVSVSVRRAAVVALRRQHSPAIAAFFDDEDLAVRQEAIRGAYDENISKTFSALSERALTIAKRVTAEVKYHPLSARRAIHAAWTLGREKDAAVITSIVNDESIDFRVRRDALVALLDWNAPPVPDPVTGFVRGLPASRVTLGGELVVQLKPYFEAAYEGGDAARLLSWALQLVQQEKFSLSAESLYRYLHDQRVPEKARVLALSLLASQEGNNVAWKKSLETLFVDESDKLRGRAREVLFQIDPDRAILQFGNILDHPKATISEKQLTLKTVSKLQRPEATKMILGALEKLVKNTIEPGLALDVVIAAEKSTSPEVKNALARFRASLPESDPFAEWKRLCLEGGSVKKGKSLFYGHGVAQCQRCHTMHGTGGTVGPELGAIGKDHSPDYLLSSLITPGKEVAAGYGVGTISLKDGTSVSGNIMSDDKDGNAVVKVGEDLKTIQKTDIASRTQPMSAMPPMSGILTKQEIRDLVAYLVSCKKDKTNDEHK